MQRFGRGIGHGLKHVWNVVKEPLKDGLGMVPVVGETLQNGVKFAEDLGHQLHHAWKHRK
jgi:hypothetical protein